MSDPLRIDGTKLMFHPARVNQWLAGKDDWNSAKSIYPLYVEISPVGACNHRCRFCALDYVLDANRAAKTAPAWDGALLRERLREMASLGVKSVMFAGEGEPLLHKEINACVLAAYEAGLKVAFTTNGVLLDRLQALDACSWVKVSIDAGTPQSHAKIHGTSEKDWGRLWRNLEDAGRRKANCQVGAQLLLLPENHLEVSLLAARCRDVGLDYFVIKPYSQGLFSKVHIGLDYSSMQEDALRAATLDQPGFRVVFRSAALAAVDKAIPYNTCHATPFFWAYLASTGDLYSCSAHLGDQRFNLGNLNTHTFREVWEGRRANWQFVREFDVSQCRVNCRMQRCNEYLDALVAGVPNVDFI